MTYEKIRERYLKSYIRDDQLDRFAALGVITSEQVEALKTDKFSTLANKSGGGGGSDLKIRLPGGIELVLRHTGEVRA